MGEIDPSFALKIELQYADSSANYKRRWAPYEYAINAADEEAAVFEAAGLKGDETVLDNGCGDGGRLLDLRHRFGHQGKLYGIDPFTAQFIATEMDMQMAEIILKEGRSESIPFPDNIFDVSMAWFSRYAVAAGQQDKAEGEERRVVKPGGKIIHGTSGEFNKPRHRAFEEVIARMTKVNPPARMNALYNSDIAAQRIALYCTDIIHIPMQGLMVFESDEDLEDYIGSLESMYLAFDPIPDGGEFKKALDFVRQKLRQELKLRGQVIDYYQRDYFIGTNNK